jgi:hypothetical protein
MAIASLREQIGRLIAAELSPRRRYRSLILQTADLAILARVCEYIRSGLTGQKGESILMDWDNFFDAVGALSCEQVRGRIRAVGTSTVVLLVGPLHYVDYWTPSVQESFWNFLSLYSNGPGIVVVDTPRTEGVEGPFVVRGTVPGTGIRYLRSRLVVAEEASV